MPTQYALEWCDSNMHRRYPLVDGATETDNSGLILPESLLVDFDLDVPVPNGSTYNGEFFISNVMHTSGAVVITIAYKTTDNQVFDCGVTNAFSDTLRNTDDLDDRTIAIHPANNIPSGYSGLAALSGRFIIGTCADVLQYGMYTFSSPTQTQLMPLRIHTRNAGLDSVTIYDKDGVQLGQFTTDFGIQAGDGITLAVDTGSNLLKITRAPMSGEDATAYSSVDDVVDAIYTAMGKPICSINGVQPDDNGAFQILQGDCTSIDQLASGISISNPCSKPCCDEASATDVRSAMKLLQSASDRLLAYYESMSTNINMLQSRLSSLIASRK